MKSFKQYLSEAEIKNLGELLKADCGPFLRKAKGKYLRRGIENLTNPDVFKAGDVSIKVYKKIVRSDRRPLGTPLVYHQIIDDWFYNKFNVMPRSKAVFCLGMKGSSMVLKDYGIPCLIFPIGDFDFIWSPKVSDLTGDIERMIDRLPDDTSPKNISKWSSKKLGPSDDDDDDDDGGLDEAVSFETKEAATYQLMSKLGYTKKNFDDAISSSNEVMILCYSYYAIPMTYFAQLRDTLESL